MISVFEADVARLSRLRPHTTSGRLSRAPAAATLTDCPSGPSSSCVVTRPSQIKKRGSMIANSLECRALTVIGSTCRRDLARGPFARESFRPAHTPCAACHRPRSQADGPRHRIATRGRSNRGTRRTRGAPASHLVAHIRRDDPSACRSRPRYVPGRSPSVKAARDHTPAKYACSLLDTNDRAAAARFLAADDSRKVERAELCVDGDLHAFSRWAGTRRSSQQKGI